MFRIVSGGQTGVDRAALDAAIENDVPAGGWCPEGRKAENGIIPAKYPVKELPGAGYRTRTEKNVTDSDGTLIVYFGFLSGGTEQTVLFCIKHKKPYLLIDAAEMAEIRASERIEKFIEKYKIVVFNVAGPRASGEAKAYGYTKKAINEYLEKKAKVLSQLLWIKDS